jgi:hypothetical protein
MNQFTAISLTSLLLGLSPLAFGADQVTAESKLQVVMAGYPDQGFFFAPVTVPVSGNPAGCTDPSRFYMEADHDYKSALAVALAAKIAGKTVRFSIVPDKCHTLQNTDQLTYSLPVVQRLGIID